MVDGVTEEDTEKLVTAEEQRRVSLHEKAEKREMRSRCIDDLVPSLLETRVGTSTR